MHNNELEKKIACTFCTAIFFYIKSEKIEKGTIFFFL